MKVSLLGLAFASLLFGQFDESVFEGINAPAALPLLRTLYNSARMNVPPADGRFLYDLVVQKAYDRGLEIGTSNGYSAIWLGLAFAKTGGRLTTIEIEEEPALEAKKNFAKAGVSSVIDLRINDAFKEIPRLTGAFDFVFLDAWKEDYKAFFDLVYPKVVPGGAIVAHNVIAQHMRMEDFLQVIRTHPKLETTFHSTSSEGISVSIKKK